MTQPENDLQIANLGTAFWTAFESVIESHSKSPVPDMALAWADLLHSGLQDVHLSGSPAVDHRQKLLQFMHPHRITTELFHVAGGGMQGGPWLDLILQIWFDTEYASGGFGVPLMMQRVPPVGPVPRPIWDELRETAGEINVATPSGRVILFRETGPISRDDMPWADYHPVVMNSFGLTALRYPPHPIYGRRLDLFCEDLASGWIGDPMLSGRESSPVLDELLSNFHVGRILRISILRRRP